MAIIVAQGEGRGGGKSSGRKVKVFRTDNGGGGGEYTSTEFENYLKNEGITHQLTVPKTPQQNGVAERMNRTLVESVRSMDVTTAFLNGDLKEEVYMKKPEGFTEKGKEHLVCRLRPSIYGHKQPPRCWNSVLDGKLKNMVFVQTTGDPCIYVKEEGGEIFIIAVYVDDIRLAGKSQWTINEVKQALA